MSAKGSRKTKSLLLAGTQFLCFGEYMLYKSGDTYSMNSCEPMEVFYNIRTDLDKLKYAVQITKIVSDVTTENQNNYKIVQLFLNTLYMISETDKNLDFILAVFKIRLLSIIGFKPMVNHCQNCEEEKDLEYFSFKDSGLKCKNCGKQDKGALKIAETTKDAIRYIVLTEPKKVFSFKVSEESLNELKIIGKIYLQEKLEKEYKI